MLDHFVHQFPVGLASGGGNGPAASVLLRVPLSVVSGNYLRTATGVKETVTRFLAGWRHRERNFRESYPLRAILCARRHRTSDRVEALKMHARLRANSFAVQARPVNPPVRVHHSSVQEVLQRVLKRARRSTY